MGRIEKVNQQLKKDISRIIRKELSDPRFTFITITHVETSKDLRQAKVFFSLLGETDQIEGILSSLDRVRGIIRKYVGKCITMRYTPELHFFYDSSIKESARLEETFKEIHNELGES
ncbi:MAG: 30S ribosome-binding factor RbfA [Candidatus Omnitrophica bacterium]|nr:30S ribosome-binding factor RbfA [Candidatus Omnitrophota bacterium]